MPANPYSGPVRIFDVNGFLLAIGTADVEDDPEAHTWGGTIEVMSGTGVAGKALVVDLEADGRRGRAQLLPNEDVGAMAQSRVVGLSPWPF